MAAGHDRAGGSQIKLNRIYMLLMKYLNKFVYMEHRPVKLYARENTPRLRYIVRTILTDILGLSIEITTDKRKLGKHLIINYSSENIYGSLQIVPDTLLFETGIMARVIKIDHWHGLPVFFTTSSESALPFDIFAASFFLITRYEEYMDSRHDTYGRYMASSSCAFQNGFLQIPVVDRWAKELAHVILKKFNTITFRRNEYKALLTIDADEPFASHGLVRSLGGYLSDFLKNDRIAAGKAKDPYEIFDFIIGSALGSNTGLKFFFPVGDHSEYDKNPSWKNGKYRKLIQQIGEKFETCLHPSYFAAENLPLILKEISRLNTITGRKIESGRFHYIRLLIPESYRNMIKAGIIEDYSMGYPDEPGFRAGIARPYYFFDLAEDKQTELKIIPFQISDQALNGHNSDPVISKNIILKLINETRKVDGLFVSIWHNTFLLDNENCKSMRDIFEFMIRNQISGKHRQ
jgi:hypothetical protein